MSPPISLMFLLRSFSGPAFWYMIILDLTLSSLLLTIVTVCRYTVYRYTMLSDAIWLWIDLLTHSWCRDFCWGCVHFFHPCHIKLAFCKTSTFLLMVLFIALHNVEYKLIVGWNGKKMHVCHRFFGLLFMEFIGWYEWFVNFYSEAQHDSENNTFMCLTTFLKKLCFASPFCDQ